MSNIEPTKPAPLSNFSAAFEEFWRLYPRKVGKLDAERIWKKVLKSERPELVIAGLKGQLEKLHKVKEERGERFVPHPSTWLNQGRWMDEEEGPKASDTAKSDLTQFIVSRVQAYKRLLGADPLKAERYFQQQPPVVRDAIERAH